MRILDAGDEAAGSGRGRKLVVSNAYPRADALYRYQFLHARMKAYRALGLPVDLYCVDQSLDDAYTYEFDGVTVHTGNPAAFEQWLVGRTYERFLVHFPSAYMLQPIERHQPMADIVLWLHGYESQAWWRRWFNYLDDSALSVDSMTSQRRHGQSRIDYLRGFLLRRPDVHVVTVSQWFRHRSIEPDLGMSLPNASVIPNYVDGNLFKAGTRTDEVCARVLVIRPFTSRKYGGKEIVETIQQVVADSAAPVHFTVCGDGENFDLLTAPLVGLRGVDLRRGYLPQEEVAALHRTHGIFLNPSFWDSQGVSTCEAMSSGLVPITSSVAAVPEFVEHDLSGLLFEPQDIRGMAEAIITLTQDPERVRSMSRAARERVQEQCGWDATIAKEADIIEGSRRPAEPQREGSVDWRASFEAVTSELEALLFMAKRDQ